MCNCRKSRPGMVTTEERKAAREARHAAEIERRAARARAREAARTKA